jgi:murein DD-endopeptidase MepM/ murein hydrolase activator NlpD
MANQGFRRSFKTPPGYHHQPGGRIALFNQVYVAYVKNNDDAFKMGRLRVWIPEFSTKADDESQWFTVQYCSPMAGATSSKDNVKEGKTLADTQQSYGWWGVPPDLDNEVVVMFLNGDPNRGIYIGGLYQQFMNHMVPGIPTDPSYQGGVEGQDPPVAEYNRWDPGVTDSDNHTRARFEPLHEGLKAQGLYTDQQRGPSNAGARRDGVSKVYGFKSPGGSHLVFDDADENQYIRIRTASGAQVLINDTAGYVYINSGNGNSWLEVSDEGIDAYSAKGISMRSQGDMNFHADGHMNFYAKKSINAYAGGDLNLITASDLSLASKGKTGIHSAGVMGIETGGVLGVTAAGSVFFKATTVQTNMVQGPKPKISQASGGPEIQDIEDRELNVNSNFEEITSKTIVSRMPTHEPWSMHPQGKTAGARAAVDLNSSTRMQVDGNATARDNTTFVSPVSGPVTSLYGPRNTGIPGASRVHRGVDVGVPRGTTVVAMRDGVVTKAGVGTGYGNVMYIKHDDGYETRYAHLTSFNVRPGTRVKQGQVIAKSGNTGVGSGPHLHFEIRKNGVAINPNAKLKNVRKGSRLTAGRN